MLGIKSNAMLNVYNQFDVVYIVDITPVIGTEILDN